MSFILQALHKAEHERDKGVEPPITTAHETVTATAQPRHWAYLALALGGAATIGIYLGITQFGPASEAENNPSAIMDSATTSTKESSPYSEPPTSKAPIQGTETQPVSSIMVKPTNHTEAERPAGNMRLHTMADRANTNSSDLRRGLDELPPEENALDPGSRQPNTTTEPDIFSSTASMPAHEILQPESALPGKQYTTIPILQNLAKAVRSQLPPLELNIHVYSPTPSRRFVYINSRRYSEGAEVTAGITIEEITSDGVILNHQGILFRLVLES